MSSHAKSTVEDPTSGWYEHFIGPRKALDTEIYRVICVANLGRSICSFIVVGFIHFLGSPFGSTSPVSQNPLTGEIYGRDFPQITPFDMARAAHKVVSEHLEISKLCSVIGGSLGKWR
jgi:homoserine O-acetyltransferase